jgi:hypothetical protein
MFLAMIVCSDSLPARRGRHDLQAMPSPATHEREEWPHERESARGGRAIRSSSVTLAANTNLDMGVSFRRFNRRYRPEAGNLARFVQ